MNYLDKFGKRYLARIFDKDGDENKHIDLEKIYQMVRIYKMAMFGNDEVDKEEFNKFMIQNNFMFDDGRLNVRIKPRRKESKLSGQARTIIENYGIILLHEVPCKSYPRLDYDYAFIYKGFLGKKYLYYVEIDVHNILTKIIFIIIRIKMLRNAMW